MTKMKRNQSGPLPATRHRRAAPGRTGGSAARASGLTLIGFIIVLAVVGLFAYVGMKLFPMYSEFYAVKQALKGLSAEPGIAKQDPARVKDLLFRRLYVSYAENVKPNNVKVTRDGNGYTITVDYEVRRELIGNLDVVGKFHASEDLVRGGAID